ncbi:MAG: hypothetical protein M9894_06470 [Planctomycetes bacterium]|nr:hypothetical protein [Planctomycetota bacterium]
MGAVVVRWRPSPERLAAGWVVATIVVALALLAVSVARYPGGSLCDPAAPGFDLRCNYLSDLLHERALDGRPNPGAWPARAAMLVFIAGLPAFWLLVPRLLPGRPDLARLARRAGWLSVPAWAAVPLVPSDRYGALHGVFIVLAAAPSLVAAAAALRGLLAERRRRALLGLGLATMLGVGAAAGLHTWQQVTGAALPLTLVPTVQKAAGALLLAWLLATAAAALRLPDDGLRGRPAPA